VRGFEQSERHANVNCTIVTTDGDHATMEVIVGLIRTYWRDILCLNNPIMDTIITTNLRSYYIYVETLRRPKTHQEY
jgi:hypothetical protein